MKVPRYYLLTLLLFCSQIFLSSCQKNSAEFKSVRFVAHIKNHGEHNKVYITGNNSALGNWKPDSIPMDKISNEQWTKTITFPANEKIEFKITGGSWWLEALDSTQNTYNNIELKVTKDTVFDVLVYDWKNTFDNGIPVLTTKRFKPERSIMVLDSFWKYHVGDSLNWANENYDDSKWISANTYIDWADKQNLKWDNVGWFRFHMLVDSSLWNRTLAINMNQLGASEIYYNGKLLYSFGKVGVSKETYEPSQNRLWKELKIEPKRKQLIAVRYANYNWKDISAQKFVPGFIIVLKDVNTILEGIYTDIRTGSSRQMIFTSIPLILFFLHLFLYVFFRKLKQNLFYSFCLLASAGITFFNYEKYIVTDPGVIILYYELGHVSGILTMFFGLLTSYEIVLNKLPKRWRIFFGLAVIMCVLAMLYPLEYFYGILFFVYFGITMLDVIISGFKNKNLNSEGRWIVQTGFIILIIFVVYQILINYNLVKPLYGINDVYVYGLLALTVATSLYLSYNYSFVNKNLEMQLENVRLLSEKAIEQERIANTREFERKLIEVEHERQRKELESARELQLSLLPNELPIIKNLDIACQMRTATEVGGDYYDFFVSEENVLTAVIGDATGHGLKAGNMVITTKGLLNVLAGENDLLKMMNVSNIAIKKMNLNMLTMGLALVRINKKKVEYSSAGMPPLLIYRSKTGKVEQLILKAMPLGAFKEFPYKKLSTTVYKNDILLMFSDGLTDLFNDRKEIFGINRVVDVLTKSAGKTAREIVDGLYINCSSWIGETPLADDVTIVAIKII